MPKLTATENDLASVESLLSQHAELRHLRVTRRANSLTLVSGPHNDPVPHVRLTRLNQSTWRVDMATHTGRWEQTPFVGPVPKVILGVLENLPWTVAPLDNPVPTSDPRY